MLSLSTLLVFVTGLLAGVVAALKVIAPKTKTTADDKVLAGATAAQGVLDKLK